MCVFVLSPFLAVSAASMSPRTLSLNAPDIQGGSGSGSGHEAAGHTGEVVSSASYALLADP